MLIRESIFHQNGVVIVMSDTAIIAASIKTTLLEIAKQSEALGMGLQNAAPGDKAAAPNNSVQYLMSSSENLTKLAEESEKFLSSFAHAG